MNESAQSTGLGGPAGAGGARRETTERRVVVIGVGNEFRRDDGLGPEVLARLRPHVAEFVHLVSSDGEPARLIEAWTGAALAVVVDAVRGDPQTSGRIHRIELDRADLGPVRTVSSHGLGLGEAIGLARALDRMPERLVVHAIEATDFGFGVGLTPAVAAGADALTAAVLIDLAAEAERASPARSPALPR
jgi:hydrogenase maturation protease